MERWMKKTIEFGAGLVLTGKSNPAVIPYYPQKTEISGREERYFHRASPERHGVSSGRLIAMIRTMEKDKRANVHNLLCIKGGEVILECSHPGYSVNIWHLSHSLSKTLTGPAIGMLVDDGKLDIDSTVVSILDGVHYNDRRFSSLTVRHLLTMSSGVRFGEAGVVSETRWTEAFFESGFNFEPGERFEYNSMNTYILARIVCKITGRSLTDFIKEKLLSPLGITNFFWELGPEGIEKGGFGVFMSAESWGKVGYMMLSGGLFRGRRIISEKWVKESTTAHSSTPEGLGRYNYGYQLWVSREGDSFLFNGMLGQNVWICPKNDIVVVVNSGNNELFQSGNVLAIIERFLGRDLSNDLTDTCFSGDISDLRRAEEHFFESRHWIRPYQSKRGFAHRIGLRYREPYPEEWNEIIGKYNFRKNNLGIIPVFIRAMQNNLKNSIDGIAFEREGSDVYFVFHEGGHSYRLPVGFYDFKDSVLNYHGEKYMVRVMGEAMEDEDRNMLFKLELLFPEMPNTRMLKFTFLEDGELYMRMSEMPNEQLGDTFTEEVMKTNPKLAFIADLLEKRVGKNFIDKKLSETFSPSLIGARVGAENYTVIMDEERAKLKANEKTVKFIDVLIDRFIRESDEEDDDDKGGIREFFGDIMDRIREKIPQKSVRALPEAEETDDKK